MTSQGSFCVSLLGTFMLLAVCASPALSGVVATGGTYVLLGGGQIYQLMPGVTEYITQVPFGITGAVYFLTVSSSDFGLLTADGHLWWFFRGGQGWRDNGYPIGEFTPVQQSTWGEVKSLYK